jgi:RNA polymerase sigma factor (sigma-70 family)
MNNHLTPGWNKSFFQWVRKVKNAISRNHHLVDKIKYYRLKLISCKGTNYNKSPTSTTNSFIDQSFNLLTKIEEIEVEINENKFLIDEFNQFISSLNDQEKRVMQDVIMDGYKASLIAKEMNISRNRIYEIKNNIIRKWSI